MRKSVSSGGGALPWFARKWLLLAAIVMLAGAPAAPAGADVKVVASLKPVHSLVAAVMKGAGEPVLIIDGAGSPHSTSLKPSQAHALSEADVVFWIGDVLETFLEKPVATIASRARVVALLDAPGLVAQPYRHGDGFAAPSENAGQATGGSGDGHDHAGTDPHVWLDPQNAKAMTMAIAAALGAADPQNAPLYDANAAELAARIDSAAAGIAEKLAPYGERPFVVFHDAYRYFETRFGLRAAGSIALNPEVAPGARQIAGMRDTVKQSGAVCVFSEPQFAPKTVEVVTEGTGAKSAMLDPLGATLENGPDLYIALLEALADAFSRCLE